MKATIVEMEGLLRGKCVPAKILVNESLAEYLVRQFDALHERADKVERERDELKRIQELNLKIKQAMHERFTRVEAELARRDAAAREPVAWVCGDEEIRDFKAGREVTIIRDCDDSDLEYLPLYTAAQPAVLPPKYADELTERAELIEAYSKTQCEIAQELGCDSDNESILKAIYELKELGAQQQKAVQLPWGEWGVFGEADLLAALDAANVKWEVKP